MVGKTGAARVALETGAPVVPVAQWGPQQLLPPYSKRPHLFPRKTDARLGRSAGGPRRSSRDRPVDAALLREVDRADHGGCDGTARGDPGRAGARRAVQPAQHGRAGDRQPAATARRRPKENRMAPHEVARCARDSAGTPHDARRGAGDRLLGHRVLDGPGRRRCRRRALGPPGRGRRTRSPTSHENPDYLPGIPLPETVRATADAAEALDGAEVVVLAVPSQTLRGNLDRVAAAAAAGLRARQPDEGHRARHHPTHERGDRRDDRCRAGAHRRRLRPQPGQGDRPAAAGRQRRRVRRRGGRGEAAAGLPDGVLPALHEHRRGRASSSAAR